MRKPPELIGRFSFFTFILETLYNKAMATIIPENEMTEVEGRVYINPQTGVDTTNAFIENLRQTQQANTQQIAQDTANLGTEVPSNLGGLTGGAGYWTSRYQVPQTNAAVANLRTAAQAQALNEVLANEQAVWKNRYQQAYRNYQSRQNAKANTPITTTPPATTTVGDVEYEDTGVTTNLDAVQDINQYDTTSTIYDSTQQSFDSRSTERDKQIEVTKDNSGNVSVLTINGVPHYGREARARYRYLKNAGLVR